MSVITLKSRLNYLSELRRVIEAFAPQASRFLEWGTGASTNVLCELAARRADPIVVSIDHNGEYLRKVAEELPYHGFLHLRQFDLPGTSSQHDDQFPSYITYPSFLKIEFDLAYVDGRRRNECALAASKVLSRDGILVIPNWRRSDHGSLRELFRTVDEREHFLVLKSKDKFDRPPIRSADRRAIIVPGRGGRALREMRVTVPYARAYAEKIGAEFFIVGEKSTLPASRLKYEAYEIAKEFDRALLIDADAIIRPGSPDIFKIVPAGSLGAFPEGAYFDREGWCRHVSELYALGDRLKSPNYINTGVLVLCRKTAAVLKPIKREILFGHPSLEQALVNAKRILLNIPLFSLPPEFNFMPEAPVFPRDWRFAFFLHFAASGKDMPKYPELYEDQQGDRRTFVLRRFISADIREGMLEQASEQISGKDVRIFDATDFSYAMSYAVPIFDENGQVVAHFPENIAVEGELAIYGPYAKLPAGRWIGHFENQQRSKVFYEGAQIDVVIDLGNTTVLQKFPWPKSGQFEFVLENGASDVEIRIYRGAGAAEFTYLRLQRLPN